MSDRVNQPKWQIKHTRVYGNGYSFNCTNKITAEQLHKTLTNYETEIHNLNKQNKTNKNIKSIDKQLKQVLTDLTILQQDIDILKDKLEV